MYEGFEGIVTGLIIMGIFFGAVLVGGAWLAIKYVWPLAVNGICQ